MSTATKICRPLCSGKADRELTGSPLTPSERFVLLSHENLVVSLSNINLLKRSIGNGGSTATTEMTLHGQYGIYG